MTTVPADSAAPALHIALVHPEIHWNTGNAGRTCLALGARLHLVRPLGFALTAREVERAGLDYWASVDPVVWAGWDEFAAHLDDFGEAYFFSAEGGRSVWDVIFPARVVLVFGGESAGLPAPLRTRYADRLVRIPMTPAPVRSLNLSTSVAVAGFEVRRQWRERGLLTPE